MPKFTKDGLTLETSHPNEISELRARGFVEDNPEAPATAEKPSSEPLEIAPVSSTPETPAFDAGGQLQGGLTDVTNDTGQHEVIKPAPKARK